MKKTLAVLALFLSSFLVKASGQTQQPQPTPPPHTVVLITATSETDTATSATGAATAIGRVAVGTAGTNTSTYEHSEVWEVVRHFSEECSAATFVTNPATPHSLTIHVDYQKVSGGFLLGTIVVYQLALLDHANNPLYVSKKELLHRQIKPICKVIQQQ